GGIDLDLAIPRSLGGSGKGHNPEQLLAAGHASCFLMVMQDIAQKRGRLADIEGVVIHAEAILGTPTDRPGWGFQVNLKVEGVEQELIDATDEACPFSRMEKEGIVLNVTK
ncbi:OsmC/Ohr family, partial [Vararia minispora EC-137]